MIDKTIFEQAKNNLFTRREETARKIFEKVASDATALNLSVLHISLSDMWEITGEKELSARDFFKIINKYLPEDAGVTCNISSGCSPTFVFEFDWLENK